MKWHYIKDNDYPQPREDKGDSDEFQCLVERKKGWFQLLYWNCYYQCWDDEQGDDNECDKDQVIRWVSLDEITIELGKVES